jgi:simple sugar transport system permease protein
VAAEGGVIDPFLHAAILMTTPILLAAIGGLVNRIGGIVNIGLEAMMLAGALVAVVVSADTGSAMLAVLAALLAGALIGLLMSLVITRLLANEIIVGLGFAVATAGLVRFLLKSVYGVSGTYNPQGVTMLPRIVIPGVDSIPVAGAIFSGLDLLTWLAWALVPATAFVLRRTRWGLRLRATGAAEATVRAVGLHPLTIRDASTVFAGALAGLAGAQLSIGIVGLFNEGITGGRGFIALAAFYFGRTSPWRTAAGALLFGAFDAAQIRLQGHGVPAELVQCLPYLIVIVVLAGLGLADRRRERARTA